MMRSSLKISYIYIISMLSDLIGSSVGGGFFFFLHVVVGD